MIFLAILSAVVVLAAVLITDYRIVKAQENIMATTAEIKAAADSIRAGLAAMETRVDKVIAGIADPSQTDKTASDAVVAELKGLASDLDAFHAPIVVASAPNP